jgi:uncharacterized membrane-anchored protein
MPVEVAAIRGERFPDEAKGDKKDDKKSSSSHSDDTKDASSGESVVAAAAPTNADAAKKSDKPYREARTTITLGAGESKDVVIRCDFEPETVLMDPDAMVLQLRRKFATAKL